MTWLQNNDANLYQALIGSVSAESLTKLNERMQTAMNLNQGWGRTQVLKYDDSYRKYLIC